MLARSSANKNSSPPNVLSVLELLEAVHGVARHLPRFDAMDELVSCIMSQHTTDANSFPAFTRLRERFPRWEDLVAAGPETVANVIRDAGLANSKAKHIIGSLEAIRIQTGEYSLDSLRDMPTADATRWLLALPGVGPKTAAIVLCFAMGRGTIPVDTHVYRVSWRLGFVPEGVGESKAQAILEQTVPEELSFRYHTAMIQHGRTICRAPTPNCDRCTLCTQCRWFASQKRQGPTAKKKTKLKAVGM